MEKNKKAMSEVIAVVLIISIVTLSVIGFKIWQDGYFSRIQADMEQDHKSEFNTGITEIIGENIYFQNDGNQKKLTAIQIKANYCEISKELKTGITQINISSCVTDVQTGIHTVIFMTNAGTYQKSMFIEMEGTELRNFN